MKNLKNILPLILLTILLLASCKDEVLVQTTFSEKYSLTCILRGDTNFQVAILTKDYPTPAIKNQPAPYVKNAKITLTTKDKEFIFSDSTKVREDTSRYKDSVYFYYLNNFTPQTQTKVKIKALLPNGKSLSSEISVPRYVDFDGAVSAVKIPPPLSDNITIAWKPNEYDLLYQLKLRIIYYKRENGTYTKHEVFVPVKYGPNDTPVFPKPSLKAEIKFPMNVFNQVMQDISKDDPNKSNYYIDKAVYDLYVFGKDLSSYYASIHFTDKYSIRLDEIDFTNINGGFGIFGCYLVEEMDLPIDESYINDFGYRKKK